MNNSAINSRIASSAGRVAALIGAKLPNGRLVEELYLGAYSRNPTPAEMKQAMAALGKAKNRQQAAEDILWALLNSKEFVFNH